MAHLFARQAVRGATRDAEPLGDLVDSQERHGDLGAPARGLVGTRYSLSQAGASSPGIPTQTVTAAAGVDAASVRPQSSHKHERVSSPSTRRNRSPRGVWIFDQARAQGRQQISRFIAASGASGGS